MAQNKTLGTVDPDKLKMDAKKIKTGDSVVKTEKKESAPSHYLVTFPKEGRRYRLGGTWYLGGVTKEVDKKSGVKTEKPLVYKIDGKYFAEIEHWAKIGECIILDNDSAS